jgi:LPS-assembly lipoprotein
MSIARRGLLQVSALMPLAALAVSACGFQPVYMPTASGQPGPSARELAAVDVGIIPDRPGQLLRQALQERFASDGGGVQQYYDLQVSFVMIADANAIRPDNISTRTRLIGTAKFVLTAKDTSHKRLVTGSARAVDAYNILDQEYFAADLSNEAVTKRIAEALADQITTQLAGYFRKRANTEG